MSDRKMIEVYQPCGCGWRYDDATLANYAMGRTQIDLNPTHFCGAPPEHGSGQLIHEPGGRRDS